MTNTYKGKSPKIHPSCYIAPGAKIVGDVTIEENCSVWYNCVLRSDVDKIHIGAGSNIQDGSIIHQHEGLPAIIGKNVTVGHGAIIHAATIGDNTLVGMGSTVLDGAVVGKNCLIGANSLITPGTIIPDGMLVLGSPAKAVKELSEEKIQALALSAEEYKERTLEYLYEETL